jgi:hypothetical protein
MKQLLYSGLLYLVGVSVVLALKPALMFTEEGTWKEFGIGRDSEQYTWLPFWLFAIIWAMLAYIIVATLVGAAGAAAMVATAATAAPVEAISVEPVAELPKPKKNSRTAAKPGYYALDMNAMSKNGVPRYVYLGPEAPNLVYNLSEKVEREAEEEEEE